MISRLFLLCLFLLPLAAVAQQTGKLVGRVMDGSGNPLPGANVTIEGPWHSTLTDVDGRYLLGAYPGRYAVAASHIAHESRTDTVSIELGSTSKHDIVLPLLPGCKPDSSYRPADLSWQELWLPHTRTITEAHGLDPLHGLSSGLREARLWVASTTTFSDPWKMARLVWNDDEVEGTVVLGWPVRLRYYSERMEPEGIEESLDKQYRSRWSSRCGPFRQGASVDTCTPVLREEPDWTSVARGMEDAGLWTLPDQTTLPDLYAPCGIPSIGMDGTTYIVELFDGAAYRAYHYWSPVANASWPEERQAARIVRIVWDDVLDLIPQTEY